MRQVFNNLVGVMSAWAGTEQRDREVPEICGHEAKAITRPCRRSTLCDRERYRTESRTNPGAPPCG